MGPERKLQLPVPFPASPIQVVALVAAIAIAFAVCRTTFKRKVRSCTTQAGQSPYWFLGYSRMAVPFCDCVQLFSKTFPSINSRTEFLVSYRFLTANLVPK